MNEKSVVSYNKYEKLKQKTKAWKDCCSQLKTEKIDLELSVEHLEHQNEFLQDEIVLLKERLEDLEQTDDEIAVKYRQIKKKNKELTKTIEQQKSAIEIYNNLKMFTNNTSNNI